MSRNLVILEIVLRKVVIGVVVFLYILGVYIWNGIVVILNERLISNKRNVRVNNNWILLVSFLVSIFCIFIMLVEFVILYK